MEKDIKRTEYHNLENTDKVGEKAGQAIEKIGNKFQKQIRKVCFMAPKEHQANFDFLAFFPTLPINRCG